MTIALTGATGFVGQAVLAEAGMDEGEIAALREAGALVAERFTEVPELIRLALAA